MMAQWNWIALGALAILVVYQQFRMYMARRESRRNVKSYSGSSRKMRPT